MKGNNHKGTDNLTVFQVLNREDQEVTPYPTVLLTHSRGQDAATPCVSITHSRRQVECFCSLEYSLHTHCYKGDQLLTHECKLTSDASGQVKETRLYSQDVLEKQGPHGETENVLVLIAQHWTLTRTNRTSHQKNAQNVHYTKFPEALVNLADNLLS